jgi:hypothetical protein
MEAEEESKKDPKDIKLPSVTIQIRPSGKYSVSQIPNVNSLKFDKDRSRRTQFVADKNPGPGTYESKQLIGRIFPSQFRSYEPISIAKRHVVKDSRSNYPGPGSYTIPSDFGIYQSKDADKYSKENVWPEKKKEFEEKARRHGMKKIKPKPQYEENYEANNGENAENEENQDNQEKEENQENQENKNEDETPENKDENKKEEESPENKEEKNDEKEEEKNDEEDLMLLRDKLQYKENETPGS